MRELKFEITKEEIKLYNEKRLDKFLVAKFHITHPEITRSKAQMLIKGGFVLDDHNEKILDSSYKVKASQILTITLPALKLNHLIAKKIDFEIIFEDEDLMVINKPAGLTVHPGAGNNEDTLVNALLFSHQNRLSTINGDFRPGIIHRLDKDTSGLMLVAKNDLAHQILSNQIKERTVKRCYLAFIYGKIEPGFGKISKNIARSRVNRLKMAIAKNSGRIATTNYSTKEVFLNGLASAVECRLETGRTHQIRVHLSSLGHSIIGDSLYGSHKRSLPDLSEETQKFIKNFPRQALHSYKISFTHPKSSKEMNFEIDLSEDLKKLKKSLA
jgi:23S rRNA pseudouridine1911/1915/1917 synthase